MLVIRWQGDRFHRTSLHAVVLLGVGCHSLFLKVVLVLLLSRDHHELLVRVMENTRVNRCVQLGRVNITNG